jgi:hypothetical protein
MIKSNTAALKTAFTPLTVPIRPDRDPPLPPASEKRTDLQLAYKSGPNPEDRATCCSECAILLQDYTVSEHRGPQSV